jgi:hypothetical protein
VAVLLLGSFSNVVDDTVTVLVRTVPDTNEALEPTVMVTADDADDANVPDRSQVTTAPDDEHVQPAPLALTYDSPAGSVSTSRTPAAALGPLLMAVRV